MTIDFLSPASSYEFYGFEFIFKNKRPLSVIILSEMVWSRPKLPCSLRARKKKKQHVEDDNQEKPACNFEST